MKKLILIMTIMLPIITNCQIKATTEHNDKVILLNDGTWINDTVFTQNTDESELKCEDVIEDNVDKMTGKSTPASKQRLIISLDGGKSGIGIFMMKIRQIMVMDIKAIGASNCIDEGSKMNVLFTDGTLLEMINISSFNCKGEFVVYFGGTYGKQKELNLFRTKNVQTIRVWTTDGYVERDFEKKDSDKLKKMFDCLNNIK